MNWSVTLRLRREVALTDAERNELLGHQKKVRDGNGPNGWDLEVTTAEPIAGVVAGGRLDLYYRDATDADTEHLCAALTQLRGLLPGAALEVCDSYELLGWNAARSRFDTMGTNDVRRFGFEGGTGFVRLSTLPYQHRFGDARITHTAARVAQEATVEAAAGVTVSGQPLFVDDERHGERRRVLAAWVHHPASTPIVVERVEATLTDASGLVVDHDVEHLGVRVVRDARLLVTVPGPPAVQKLARTIALVACTEHHFEQPLGAFTVTRSSGAMALSAVPSAAPSPFPVDLALSGFADVGEPDRSWRFVVELRARTPVESARVEVVLDLLDGSGRTLATERRSMDLHHDGPARMAFPVWHAAHELGEVASVSLTGVFRVERRLPLGAFALPAS